MTRSRESRPTQVVQSHSGVPGVRGCDDSLCFVYDALLHQPVNYVQAEVSCIAVLQVLEHQQVNKSLKQFQISI